MITATACAILFVAIVIYALYQWANLPLLDEDGRPTSGPGLQATEFPEQTVVIAKDQPQYRPLPALVLNSVEGEVITCWRLRPRERIKVVFSGLLWASQWTFQSPMQPVFFTVDKTDLIRHQQAPAAATPN